MFASFIVLAVLFGLVYGKSLTVEDQVQVQVYYESLCPDSIAFITEKLFPTFITLPNKINLELIPWGFASETTVNGTKTFTCQHGPKECYGNKAHACAISLTSINDSTEFVFCSERADAPTDDATLKQCAQEVGISWTDLQTCISSGKGDDLLSTNGKKTALINPKFVPTIVFDGEFSQANQDKALVEFKQLVCQYIGWEGAACQC